MLREEAKLLPKPGDLCKEDPFTTEVNDLFMRLESRGFYDSI